MECDSYVIRSYQERRHIITLLNRLQLPVYFRLLYSSGMRTCEVRWLKCSDVNFESGIVKIIKSKSIDEHVIVLHDSMLQLLQNYNQAMEKVMPNRIYLFPDKKDEPHKIRWGCTFFKKIWSKVSDEKAVEYDLRSLYAVTNISGWENHGYELSGNSCSYPVAWDTEISKALSVIFILPQCLQISSNVTVPKKSVN
ncbi:MAG: tyrosine-type recombinase/integrase [Parabacteroides distasonis]